jgi:hypothetical protein
MKKLSVLMASLMCLTVGGVYAAWTYAETNIANYHSEEKVVALAEVSTDSTAYGTYKVEFSDDFKIEIDSAQALGLTGKARPSNTNPETDKNNVYHQHEAVLTATGSITVSFKPSAQASDDIKDFGILTNVYFSTSKEMGTMQWEGSNIFEFNAHSCTFGFGDDNLATGAVDSAKWTKLEDGRFEYVFDTATLKSIFTLREGIVLDSSKLHDDFFMITEGLTTTVHMHQVSATVSD